jgi:solute carrier family 25 oxoglutarate transporter 11
MAPGFWHNFASSSIAGVAASTLSLPFDFVKTRLQKQQPLPDGSFPYKNFMDCGIKSIKSEGIIVYSHCYSNMSLSYDTHMMVFLLMLFKNRYFLSI